MSPHLLIFYFLGALVFTLARLAYDEWRVWRDSHHRTERSELPSPRTLVDVLGRRGNHT